MHELSITRSIVSIVEEKAAGRRVAAVRLQIGKLSGVEIQAIRFCYDVCAAGAALEGSTLQIDEVDGRGRCTACEQSVPMDTSHRVAHARRRRPWSSRTARSCS